MMKLAFTGHRDSTVSTAALDEVAARFPDALWVHGGNRGFDSQVAAYATAHGIATEVIRPNYRRYGRPAPLIRNREIVTGAACLIACYDGRSSGGTAYTVGYARKQGIPVQVLAPVENGKGH